MCRFRDCRRCKLIEHLIDIQLREGLIRPVDLWTREGWVWLSFLDASDSLGSTLVGWLEGHTFRCLMDPHSS